MAALAMTLNRYSGQGNSVTYKQASHSLTKPRLVIFKRKVASKLGEVSEIAIKALTSTELSDGTPIQQKVSAEVLVRIPYNSDATDVTNIKSDIQDIVQSTEFVDSLSDGFFVA